eukprot:535730_1
MSKFPIIKTKYYQCCCLILVATFFVMNISIEMWNITTSNGGNVQKKNNNEHMNRFLDIIKKSKNPSKYIFTENSTNFYMCNILIHNTKCHYFYRNESISKKDNIYFHHITCPVIKLNIGTGNLRLLYPEFIHNYTAISFAVYINIKQPHRPNNIEYKRMKKIFSSQCKVIEFNTNKNNITRTLIGQIKFKMMGTFCQLNESNVTQFSVDYTYYLIVKNNIIFQLYIPSKSLFNLHTISVGIHSPIYSGEIKHENQLKMSAYFTHINYHINLGVTAYFLYDIYGDLYYNFYNEWILNNNSNKLNIPNTTRIDIIIYHMAHLMSNEYDRNDENLVMSHKLLPRKMSPRPTFRPYDIQDIVIGLIYFKSLSIGTKWTLFIDLDEFVFVSSVYKKGLISYLKDKQNMTAIVVKRYTYIVHVCYEEVKNEGLNLKYPLNTMLVRVQNALDNGKLLIQCNKADAMIKVHEILFVNQYHVNDINIGHYRKHYKNQCKKK